MHGAARLVASIVIAWNAGCTATRLDIIAENENANDTESMGGTTSASDIEGTGGTTSAFDAGTGGAPEQIVPFPVDLTPLECRQGTYPGYGSYHLRLRSTQACLAAGAAMVLAYEEYTLNAFLVDVATPCVTSSTQNWKVRSFGVQYTFELINVATDYALDVKFQEVTAGTEVILYQNTFGYNQQYIFNARTDGTFGIENRNAAGLCVTATDLGVQILQCDTANPLQGWEFVPDYCG